MRLHKAKPALHSADFSGQEALAELVLLEDHLRYDDMRCLACIHKHALRAYAYAKEAVGLDKNDVVHRKIYDFINEVLLPGLEDESTWCKIADKIRELRRDAFSRRPSLHAH
jgi:hypothetical protein